MSKPQSAGDVGRAAVTSIKRSAPAGQAPKPERQRIANMRALWGRMAAMYGGARWASATSALPCGDDGKLTLAADTWAAALADITPDQIAAGLRACLASNDEYVPTAMLFRARCLGVPSLAFARLALRDGRMIAPTPFTRLLWAMLDHYALGRADQQRAERMIADAYALASEHVMRGGALPDEPIADLDAPAPAPRTPASAETVAGSMAAIEAALGMGAAT